MIIRKLILHNFGVYAGTNIFEFKSDKPVVLIGGLNGRGKTTFLEAVLLALYGANSFAYNESKYKSYGQYLRAFVNKSDETLTSYVELHFVMDTTVKESYRVCREWSASGKRTAEKIQVYKEGELNNFLTENWSMFIENILPSGLSNFFFFDGEKIAELAVENTNSHMKESIKALLGISVLDMLEGDINRIISRITKNNQSNLELKEIEILREKRDITSATLVAADEKILDLEKKIDDTKRKLEQANLEYVAKGGDIVAQRQELFNKRALLTSRIEQNKETLINDAASELPLFLVKNILQRIHKQAITEHEKKVMQLAISKMQDMLSGFAQNNKVALDGAKAFVTYMESQSDKDKTEMIFNLPDTSLYQLNTLLNSRLENKFKEVKQHKTSMEKNREEADQIDSYLSVDIDEKAITRIYKRIKTLEQELIELEVEMNTALNNRSTLNGQAITANSEFTKRIEAYLKKVELNDDSDRILKYTRIATDILDEYKIRLQKQKTGVVAETMTQCYKKLANKKNLIDKIIMDPVTLDIIYLSTDGDEVPKASLSAGEKQLMVISLLWALAICSKKKLPVIVDTPLSRLDSSHRTTIISTYFPNASDQTIILSTDSEIDRRYYEMMKDDVGDEFTLEYNDDSKSTSIHSGYFVEGMI